MPGMDQNPTRGALHPGDRRDSPIPFSGDRISATFRQLQVCFEVGPVVAPVVGQPEGIQNLADLTAVVDLVSARQLVKQLSQTDRRMSLLSGCRFLTPHAQVPRVCFQTRFAPFQTILN